MARTISSLKITPRSFMLHSPFEIDILVNRAERQLQLLGDFPAADTFMMKLPRQFNISLTIFR
ncbi:TPA: hypothetical protein R4A54_002746 [Salmonella enterica subsp. enterica serovar Schwarzengrund]|nr:hypothetical protein [Salmonella enterica subsp. enterica serovar Schwarzengrund]